VAVQKQSDESLSLADESSMESERVIFYRDDFALLTDDIECRIVRIGDISLLEACRNFTLVHFPGGKLLIRRSLGNCERRLDSSIFFRASRGLLLTSAK
jgi:DNA-binding LytR/AlgR family response regulator